MSQRRGVFLKTWWSPYLGEWRPFHDNYVSWSNPGCVFSGDAVFILTQTPTPTMTNTPTVTPSVTPTLTSTQTPSVTPTNTSSVTPSVTPSITASITPSVTETSTPTPSVTQTNTPSVTPTRTPQITPTSTSTPTVTPTITNTPSTTPIPSCMLSFNFVDNPGTLFNYPIGPYVYSGVGYYNTTTSTWVNGQTPTGDFYSIYVCQSGATFTNIIWQSNSSGTNQDSAIYETTGSSINNGGYIDNSALLDANYFTIVSKKLPEQGIYTLGEILYPTNCVTPTMTPTLSLTPSVTPCVCQRYTIGNSGFACSVFDYTECNGTRVTNYVLCGGASTTICACLGSVSAASMDNSYIIDGGSCSITPTPSATPTLTPSATLTATPTMTPGVYAYYTTFSGYATMNDACASGKTCERVLYSTDNPLVSSPVRSKLYTDPALTTLFNGGALRYALNLNCSGTWRAAQITTIGEVFSINTSCP